MEKSKTDKKRETILSQIKKKRGSSSINLTTKEKKVNKKLLNLVKKIKDDSKINLLSNLFILKEDLKKTELFSSLKKMPKGVINHLHLPAGFSYEKFKEVCFDSRVFINKKKNNLKIFLENEKIEDDFIPFSDLSEKEADFVIKKAICLTENEFLKKNDKCIFECFGKKFDFLMILYYEPFFKVLFDDMMLLLQDDNIQGVEFRHVFCWNKNEFNKKQTKKGELDFFQGLKTKNRLKNDIKISFIVTTIKTMGEDHFNELFNFYKNSLNSHPNLITGFDMVHYEDSVYIKHFQKKLLQESQKDKRIKYYLHAGETLNKNNNNVLDSILTGTKRIGHGLAIQTSPILIDLVKEYDICVETNPLSNYLLGYCRDLRWHPAKFLINCGIKLSINPDDYLIFGEKGTTMDFLLAMVFWEFDLCDVKWCILNSIEYSSFCQEVKEEILEVFEGKWEVFIDGFRN